MTASGSNVTWRRLIRLGGTLILTVLFIRLLTQQDWSRVVEHMRGVPAWMFLTACILLASGQIFNALRWYVIVRVQMPRVSLRSIVQIVFAGSFASNFLPSTVGGDIVRIAGLSRYPVSRSFVVGSVLLDRLLNVSAMLTVLPVAGVVFGWPHAVIGFQAIILPWRWSRVQAYTTIWLRSWKKLEELASSWRRHPGVLLRAFLISWLSILVIFLGVWILALGMNISVALPQVMAVSTLTYLITLLPISVNGYGLREVAFTTLYVQLGATLEQASTLALITRLIMLLATIPGALWLPAILTNRPR